MDKFVAVEFRSELVKAALKMVRIEELDSLLKLRDRCGFEVINLRKYSKVVDFLKFGLDWVREKACDKENEPNCSELMNLGYVCEDIINFMSEYDVDWTDLDRDGELYICLSLFAKNTSKCILMKGGINNA